MATPPSVFISDCRTSDRASGTTSGTTSDNASGHGADGAEPRATGAGRRTPRALGVLLALLASASLSVATTGCKAKDTPSEGEGDDSNALAEEGTESNAVETDNELLTSSLLSASGGGGTLGLASAAELGAELTPSDVGDGAKAIYFPRGCLTVTSEPANRLVTYVFDQCTGPNGLFRITGQVKATWEITAGKLDLDLVGTDLKINRATVDWSAHVALSGDGATRSMAWKAELSGQTPKGRQLIRSNEKTVTWSLGDRCVAISGLSEGKVAKRLLRTQITDLERCDNACPAAGGKIAITDVESGKKIEIAFDGTTNAAIADENGTQFVIALECE